MNKEYDIIVIGSGAGLNIAQAAREKGQKVAIFENGPMGGTCLNRGCIPSKIWTTVADVIRQAEDSRSIGVSMKAETVDFALIRQRLTKMTHGDSKSIERSVEGDKGIDLFKKTAEFVGPKTIKAGIKTVKADKIVIANGTRTMVPAIPGLEKTGYLTSEDVFEIKTPPRSLIILGGGYKAAEFGHFFSAIGVDVTIVGRNSRFLPSEEPEAGEAVLEGLSKHVDFYLGYEVKEVNVQGAMKRVSLKSGDDHQELDAEEILVCTGVRNNNDLLQPEKSGVDLDINGYIIVDKQLRTNVDGIYAFGDTIGRNMFRHNANYQSMIVWQNINGQTVEMDESVIPHAVFSWPQIASVGLKEADAKARGIEVLIGHHRYHDTGKGYAMDSKDGFVKVVVDKESMSILGATVCGPEATSLLQGVVYMMMSGKGSPAPLMRSQVIHPTLSEVVDRAFRGLHVH